MLDRRSASEMGTSERRGPMDDDGVEVEDRSGEDGKDLPGFNRRSMWARVTGLTLSQI